MLWVLLSLDTYTYDLVMKHNFHNVYEEAF